MEEREKEGKRTEKKKKRKGREEKRRDEEEIKKGIERKREEGRKTGSGASNEIGMGDSPTRSADSAGVWPSNTPNLPYAPIRDAFSPG